MTTEPKCWAGALYQHALKQEPEHEPEHQTPLCTHPGCELSATNCCDICYRDVCKAHENHIDEMTLCAACAARVMALRRGDRPVETPKPNPRLELVRLFPVQDALDAMRTATVAMQEALEEKGSCQAHLRQLTQRMEDAKGYILLSGAIDGKNAEIREAQLRSALNQNADWSLAATTAEAYRRSLEEADARIEVERMKYNAAREEARAATAALQVLAGQ